MYTAIDKNCGSIKHIIEISVKTEEHTVSSIIAMRCPIGFWYLLTDTISEYDFS